MIVQEAQEPSGDSEPDEATAFDFEKILASKRAMRRKLATLPIAEKLRMLDELRERTLAIREARKRRKPKG